MTSSMVLKSQNGRLQHSYRGLTNIYLDPKDAERLEFARIFDMLAASADECWSPTYSEFAEWWSGSRPARERAKEPDEGLHHS